MAVKTRFAPSPTGYLHIGSLRTVVYSYLFAKKYQGTFLLRIEDTDQSRLVEGAVEQLLDTLKRVGIGIDEGPYVQSERLEIYKEHAQKLIDSGHAYHCFCSRERLDEVREQQRLAKLQPKYDRACLGLDKEEVEKRLAAGEDHVIRLQMPEGETVFEDAIRGSVKINNSEIDDQVLVKTDGFPTYHLAVVVDDHLMGITHIIRGEEWISSVPKHIALYKAFGFELPVYAHLPLVLNPDKSKLSKRQGDVAVEDYLAKGFLPEALVNFVALLGFNPSGDKEIYTVEELTDGFDLSKVNKSGAVFDQEKLRWMNAQYLKALSDDELLERVKPFLTDEVEEGLLGRIVAIEKDRMQVLGDLQEQLGMYTQALCYEPEILVWRKADAEDAKKQLAGVLEVVRAFDDTTWGSLELIETGVKRYIEANELSNGNVLWPLRVALSGDARSPSPFELLWVLGKTVSIERIENALAHLS